MDYSVKQSNGKDGFCLVTLSINEDIHNFYTCELPLIYVYEEFDALTIIENGTTHQQQLLPVFLFPIKGTVHPISRMTNKDVESLFIYLFLHCNGPSKRVYLPRILSKKMKTVDLFFSIINTFSYCSLQ